MASMDTETIVPVAQPGAEMFERNLAIWVARQKELRVVLMDGSEYIGFPSGLDDETLQVCKTDDQGYVLINRLGYLAIEETGATLQTCSLSQEGRERIAPKIRNFTNVMRAHAPSRRDKPGEWEQDSNSLG